MYITYMYVLTYVIKKLLLLRVSAHVMSSVEGLSTEWSQYVGLSQLCYRITGCFKSKIARVSKKGPYLSHSTRMSSFT